MAKKRPNFVATGTIIDNDTIAGDTGLSVSNDGTQSIADADGNGIDGANNVSVNRIIDPGDFGDTAGDGSDSGDTPRKRRGRPAGSKNRGSSSNSRPSKTTSNLDSILYSVHTMGAMFLKIPELMINEEESKQLAEAINKVTELYDIPILSDKSMAWMGLAMAAGSIYGPRMVAAKLSRPGKPKLVPQNKPVAPSPIQVAPVPIRVDESNPPKPAAPTFPNFMPTETDPVEIGD